MAAYRLMTDLVRLRLALVTVVYASIVALTLGWSTWISPQLRDAILICALSILFNGLLLEWYLQGSMRFLEMSASQVINRVAYLVLIVALVRDSGDVWLAALASAIGSLVGMGFSWWRVFQPTGQRTDFRWARSVTLFQAALPMGMASACTLIYNLADNLILASFWSESEVGFYRAAMRLEPIVTMLPMVLTQVFFPVLSRWPRQSGSATQYLRFVVLIVATTLFISGCVMVAAPWIVRFAYGEAYGPSIPLLQILVWKMAFISTSFAFGQTLQAWGKEHRHLMIVVLAGLSSFGLNLAFIPTFGANGAAAISVAVEALVTILFAVGVMLGWRGLRHSITPTSALNH